MANVITSTLDEFMTPVAGLFDSTPSRRKNDFEEGFIIEELPAVGVGKKIVLQGRMLPVIPFTIGGKQRVVKEYYPGNEEPAVQMLGGQEEPLVIKGRFYAKHYRGEDDVRSVPDLLRREFEALRNRGNVVKLKLGEWQQWGILERTSFAVKTLADIDYEMEFFLIGDRPPTRCKITEDKSFTVAELGVDLMASALQFEAAALQRPGDFPSTLFENIQSLVSGVATAMAVVVKFVEQVASVAENAQKTANQALGLIKYAQATIARFKRQVGFLDLYVKGLDGEPDASISETKKIAMSKYILAVQKGPSKAPLVISAAMLSAAQSKAPAYSTSATTQQKALAKGTGVTMVSTLERLKAQFTALSETIPAGRHLVREVDTLQTISMKWYSSADHWKLIYDHNKLTTTALTVGSILEIPRL